MENKKLTKEKCGDALSAMRELFHLYDFNYDLDYGEFIHYSKALITLEELFLEHFKEV